MFFSMVQYYREKRKRKVKYHVLCQQSHTGAAPHVP